MRFNKNKAMKTPEQLSGMTLVEIENDEMDNPDRSHFLTYWNAKMLVQKRKEHDQGKAL